MGSSFTAATTSPFDLARRQRVQLLVSIQAVERALARPIAEPGWRPGLAECLTSLVEAFADHMEVTEGPDGLYTELLDHAPRLARGVYVLTREHTALSRTLDTVWQRLPRSNPDDLRVRAGDLLRELSQHRQRGADLVYEAYQTDIGGET
ncbi:hemerythrin domain-containing protein [Rugosimonospora africana]|uniref:Hemerythrin HHE cation binding domain-containing protein n=1 Tax=Rugosimonospora africana TaxID=556532 RepID=A0A8J3VP21_9ACTN|nr:hemerythrin domain-containing protein [Rugosimonospora africana]GIH12808.1 hypothetical protein Raf01_09800 [Rugosimonospora africana]